MGHDIHYCECGEEIFHDMEECSLCATKTDRRAGYDSLERLVRCARTNTATGVPSFIVLSFLLVALHNQGTHAAEERIICGAIGLIIGWLAGLWACCFYLKYGGIAPNDTR